MRCTSGMHNNSTCADVGTGCWLLQALPEMNEQHLSPPPPHKRHTKTVLTGVCRCVRCTMRPPLCLTRKLCTMMVRINCTACSLHAGKGGVAVAGLIPACRLGCARARAPAGLLPCQPRSRACTSRLGVLTGPSLHPGLQGTLPQRAAWVHPRPPPKSAADGVKRTQRGARAACCAITLCTLPDSIHPSRPWPYHGKGSTALCKEQHAHTRMPSTHVGKAAAQAVQVRLRVERVVARLAAAKHPRADAVPPAAGHGETGT